jgi:hypothetical protein
VLAKHTSDARAGEFEQAVEIASNRPSRQRIVAVEIQ